MPNPTPKEIGYKITDRFFKDFSNPKWQGPNFTWDSLIQFCVDHVDIVCEFRGKKLKECQDATRERATELAQKKNKEVKKS